MKILWKSSRDDFWTFACCLLATVGLGTQGGLVVGIAVSFVFICIRMIQVNKSEHKEITAINNTNHDVLICKRYLHFLNRHHFHHQVETVMEVRMKNYMIIRNVNIVMLI